MENTRITVAKLKVAKFMSEETLCFEATILLDGKPFATASNEGHGGMTFVRPFTTAREQFDEAQAYAKAIPDMDLERLVDELANKALLRKDVEAQLRRGFKKKAIYIENGQLWNSKPKNSALINEAFFALVQKMHPTANILNRLPLSEAVDAYIAVVEAQDAAETV